MELTESLAGTEALVPVLDGYPQAFPPGKRFAYCNGGYVVLALLAERTHGGPHRVARCGRRDEPVTPRRAG